MTIRELIAALQRLVEQRQIVADYRVTTACGTRGFDGVLEEDDERRAVNLE